MDCSSPTDCKFVYENNGSSIVFADCDNAACSSGSITDLGGFDWGQQGKAIACPATDNCKVFYETDLFSDVLFFADCGNDNCFPTPSDLDDPWTGQTNVSDVSITYDSSNSDLYAHIIKDTDEKAYWKSTDATTILWGGENDYGWSGTGDHLDYISSPQSGAGQSQIGVALREGSASNYEFSAVPERSLFLLGVVPFLPKLFLKMRKRVRAMKQLKIKP